VSAEYYGTVVGSLAGSVVREEPEEPVTLRVDVADPARTYGYLLGGKEYFPADRDLAEALYQVTPDVVTAAVQNRAFLRRAVRAMAADGVDQFLDVGVGLPLSPNLHEVAQLVTPSARVGYVDRDPLVLLHARALLTSGPQGRVDYVAGDVRDPAAILASPAVAATLDLSRPVGLTLLGVLPFITDDDNPAKLLAALVGALARGSRLVISHPTADFAPDAATEMVEVYGKGGIAFRPRSRAEIGALVPAGVEILKPGVVAVHRWWPEPNAKEYPDGQVSVYGLVGQVR